MYIVEHIYFYDRIHKGLLYVVLDKTVEADI